MTHPSANIARIDGAGTTDGAGRAKHSRASSDSFARRDRFHGLIQGSLLCAAALVAVIFVVVLGSAP